MYNRCLGLKGEGVPGHVTTACKGANVTDLLMRHWMEVTGQRFAPFRLTPEKKHLVPI
jgi:hypothetical protein